MLVPWRIICEDSEESSSLLENILEVAAADPLIFDEVVLGILQSDSGIRAQAAAMVEKITQVRPLFLTPYKRVLLKELAGIEQVKVRMQVALLYGRVFWDEWELQQVVSSLEKWIETEQDEYIILNSIQSLHTLAMQKAWIRPIVLQQLTNAKGHTSLLVRNLAEKLQL